MRGLRHVQHCNVNCSSLERSLPFYEGLGLTRQVRTFPEPQDGSGFGIDGTAQWDAWMMSDGRAAPVIDLLEWHQPRPTGRPHGPEGLGLVELRIEHPAVAEPTVETDPDATRVALRPGETTRFCGVRLNVRDAAASAEWYGNVLGLTLDGDTVTVPGDEFAIELTEIGEGAAPYPRANHLGIYRMAFLVDDARAAHADLVAREVATGAPVWLDMGPTVPIDGLWAVFFFDPDGTCLELIQAP